MKPTRSQDRTTSRIKSLARNCVLQGVKNADASNGECGTYECIEFLIFKLVESERKKERARALREAATVAWSYDLATAQPLQREIARNIQLEILALGRSQKKP